MVSDLTFSYITNYLNLQEDDLTEEDKNFLKDAQSIAKEYILDYTGASDIDSKEAFQIAYLVLIQDMWDNRTLYPDGKEANEVISNILGMHSVNLL